MLRDRDDRYKIAVYINEEGDWLQYKRIQNSVVNKICVEKERYLYSLIDTNKNNSRELWKNLKQFVPDNRAGNVEVKSVNFHNIITSDPQVIAENFNKYLIKSLQAIVDGIHSMNSCEDKVKNIPFFA